MTLVSTAQPAGTGPLPTDASGTLAGQALPTIDLRAIQRLTDDTGMLQHAIYATPNPHHGYCIDDNARGLIAAATYAHLWPQDTQAVPIDRYLAFLTYAFHEKIGRFRNFMGYDRNWLEDEGSPDSQGRTLWALGLTVALAPFEQTRRLAQHLFRNSLPLVEDLDYLRSRTFALIGMDWYLKVEPGETLAREMHERFAVWLLARWREHSSDDWPWWEDQLFYDNAKLPHALLLAGQTLKRPEMIDIGLRSLQWLLDVQKAPQDNGQSTADPHASQAWHLSIVGNQGWYPRGGQRAPFDQQPLEAYALVDACLEAARITGDDAWTHAAWRCFEWFGGRNDGGVPLYDATTGGCCDGLQVHGPNHNQGAESCLAHLLSALELHRHHRLQAGNVATP